MERPPVTSDTPEQETEVRLSTVNNLLKNTRVTRGAQVVFFALFAFIMASLFVSAAVRGDNPGANIIWLLWWPLIPLTFIFAGRFWCAVCPFGAVSDQTRRFVGLKLPVPKFLKKSGLWVINGLFFLVTWYDLTFGLTTSVQATGMFFLLMLIAVLIFSVLFDRRAWCRYVCPVGGVFGNYAQTSVIEMQNKPEVCAACTDLHCFNGREDIPGCALSLTPKTLESNRMCNFCGDCLKSCEKDSPSIGVRSQPGQELWLKKKPRFDEAFLAAALVGFISISTLGMLEIWPVITGAAGGSGRGGWLINTLFMFLIFGGIVGLYALASFISAKLGHEKTVASFKRFGYALIPISLATHIAHNMNHFLNEGKLIIPSFIRLVTFAGPSEAVPTEHGSAALVGAPFIQGLQFILVGLGILLSFYVANKIATKDKSRLRDAAASLAVAWPHFIVIGFYGFLSFWLFSLPMMMRH